MLDSKSPVNVLSADKNNRVSAPKELNGKLVHEKIMVPRTYSVQGLLQRNISPKDALIKEIKEEIENEKPNIKKMVHDMR